jgi:hypothetical protein
LKPDTAHWNALSYGQYRLYSNLVRVGNDKIIVVLCQHETPPERRIDTTEDIAALSLSRWTKEGLQIKRYP